MTGLQILVNVVLAVLTFFVVKWLLEYIPSIPQVIVMLSAAIIALAVFFSNAAARIAVR